MTTFNPGTIFGQDQVGKRTPVTAELIGPLRFIKRFAGIFRFNVAEHERAWIARHDKIGRAARHARRFVGGVDHRLKRFGKLLQRRPLGVFGGLSNVKFALDGVQVEIDRGCPEPIRHT